MKDKIIKILKWSEKYTKTDMVYLFKNGFWATTRQIIATFFIFLSSIIFARFVPEENYGIYKYLVSMSGVVSSFLLLGASFGAMRYASQGYMNALRHSFKETLTWSAPAVIVAFIIGAYYLIQENLTLVIGLFAIMIAIPITYASMNWSAFLTGVKDFKNITIFSAFVSIGTTLIIIITIYFSKNPLTIFLSYLISGAILNLIVYKISLIKYENKSPQIPHKEFFIYSFHQTLNNALPTIASQADKIFIFQQLGALELAIYSFAVAIPDQINALFGNISRIAFPKFVNRTLEEIKQNLWRRVVIFTFFAFISSGIYILCAPYIYEFFFPRYIASIPYSQILSLFIFTSLANIPLTILQAKNKTLPLYANNIFTSIVQIILNYFLISSYGIMGAIISVSLVKIITLAASLLTIKFLKDEGENAPTISTSPQIS